jgi:site-specific DNA-methyltransferase (adenine-specific)
LTCDWSSVSDSNGKRIDVGSAFQNPPYGRRVTGLFVRACYEQSRKGITVALVIFARTDTIWWHEYAMKAAELRLLRGRVKFIDPDTGEEGDAAGAPTVVLVFRPGHEGPPDVSAMVRENGQARLFGVKGG